MYVLIIPSLANQRLALYLPDLPRPRVRGMKGIPVALNPLALGEHFRSHSVYERVPVNRHEVILLDEGALDGLDNPVSLVRFGACLMLSPQLLNVWLADKGGRAAADGVDADVRLGTPGPRIDVLHDSPIAGKSLSALADLGAEGGTLQRLELAANPNRAK